MKPTVDDSSLHAASHSPSCTLKALGTWSAGKEPDALSNLVTVRIFHVQKLLYAGRGMHLLHPPLDPPLAYT